MRGASAGTAVPSMPAAKCNSRASTASLDAAADKGGAAAVKLLGSCCFGACPKASPRSPRASCCSNRCCFKCFLESAFVQAFFKQMVKPCRRPMHPAPLRCHSLSCRTCTSRSAEALQPVRGLLQQEDMSDLGIWSLQHTYLFLRRHKNT